jgi:hypothetical protein
MCKPSCCPGDSNGTGLGLALAVVAVLALVSAAARPVIHAVEVIAQVALIIAAALLGVALAALVTILVIRVRSARRFRAAQLRRQLAAHTTAPAVPAAPTWARAAITGRISALGTASHCPACGTAPSEPRRL